MIKSIWLLIPVALLLACDPDRVFEENKNLEEAYWHKDSLVTFEFDVPATDRKYNLYANIRNAQHFPFYNLYYQYTLSDTSGVVLAQELKNIDLFDPKTGEPYGSGLGDLFDHRQLLLSAYDFPAQGKYTLTFEQYMRQDSLALIMSVGARLEQVSGQ